ncbi:hypothetical protein M413DRAFT_442309 [Hebeloma cylindrosporum]|uniref:Uncharacterized protein n=1 Tax=Hebeloma cylindrosporum TaxID=76867 RepID=A0A0C3CNL6_HEBCY|nr:hypothetical protein M413DRAFT_442309 [Hebeloma cylindrosporum h7]
MTWQCMRCTRDTKILRPARCSALDGLKNPCSACTEDIELEKELESLEIQVEKIRTRRRALRTVMNQNHDPFIHKFPPEIASLIFIQYAPPGSPFFDGSETSTPLYLGAVCQKWRQLAWRTPQLWSWLVVKFRPYTSQLLAEHLERSASLPLTIGLCPDAKEEIGDNVYLEAINILNKHSSRWRVLHCAIPAYHFHHLCGSPEGNILRRLVLRALTESNRDRDPSTIPQFSMKCKPSPTHLTLAKHRLANVDITWNYLTAAEIEDISVDECFELMRRAPLLKVLRFIGIIWSSGIFPIPTTRIVLPHLKWLAIWKISDEIVGEILDSICAPSLKHWNVHIQGRFPSLISKMVSFINHSSFSLVAFQVSGNVDFYDRVHEVLDHLPSLKLLTLRFRFHRRQTLTDELLHRLCTSNDSSPFLPHPKILEFDPQFTFPWESLLQIFSSFTRRFLRVKINQEERPRILGETAEKLLELIDEGFNLTISREGVDILEERRRILEKPVE